MVNAKLKTGEIEVYVDDLHILNESKTPPFPGWEDQEVSEALRLRYRYLDLRNAQLQNNLKLRHRITQVTRRVLDEQSFIEVETPILTRSTPEGARDYLVPSRLNPQKFYASAMKTCARTGNRNSPRSIWRCLLPMKPRCLKLLKR
jgi:aspartyl-tRNA synthetase